MQYDYPGVDWREYDVHGDTLDDVAQAISHLDEAGTAEWFPSYSYEEADGRITAFRVTLGTRITLPRWIERSSASAPEQTEWDRALRALTEHEEGHLQIACFVLDTAPDDDFVGQTTDAAAANWTALLAELQRHSNDFDASTNHGRVGGTDLDLSVGVV